jgi:hypothetical protein
LPKIGNLKAGTYHLTITDKNGCIINRSFDLIQPDAIKLGDTLIQKNICNGDSMASIDVSIIGGVGQYEYIWSNGDKSKKVTNLKQGHYSLTVTDSAKCTQKYQFSIMDYPKLIFDSAFFNDSSFECTITNSFIPTTWFSKDLIDLSNKSSNDFTSDELKGKITDTSKMFFSSIILFFFY